VRGQINVKKYPLLQTTWPQLINQIKLLVISISLHCNKVSQLYFFRVLPNWRSTIFKRKIDHLSTYIVLFTHSGVYETITDIPKSHCELFKAEQWLCWDQANMWHQSYSYLQLIHVRRESIWTATLVFLQAQSQSTEGMNIIITLFHRMVTISSEFCSVNWVLNQ